MPLDPRGGILIGPEPPTAKATAVPTAKLLICTDLHLARPDHLPDDRPDGAWADEWLARAVNAADQQGGFDALVLLGDLLNDHRTGDGQALLARLRQAIEPVLKGRPVLVCPGNHDGSAQLLTDAGWPAQPRPAEVNGVRLFAFADAYDPQPHGDVATRPSEQLDRFLGFAANSDAPLVALQHNPIHPPIDDPYPYLPTNAPAIRDAYARAGVTLSLSGHYHPGQPLSELDGVHYATVPALCKPPFCYGLAEIGPDGAKLHIGALQTDRSGVWDVHAHTELAYCGKDVSAAHLVDRAGRLGLAGVVVTEHAPQLYVSAEEFWEALHIRQPHRWREPSADRTDAFWRLVAPLRDRPDVRVGLECEIDADGQLTCRPEDRRQADVIIGAVHFLFRTQAEHDVADESQIAAEVRRQNRALIDAGIDILAHPFRQFRSHRIDVPETMFDELADWLADANVAAEVNFHNHPPYRRFIRACLERGVKLAFASDAHWSHESAGLAVHADLLRELAGTDDMESLLWQPNP